MPTMQGYKPPSYVLTRHGLPRLQINARVYVARKPLQEIGTIYTPNLADAWHWQCRNTAVRYTQNHPERTKLFCVVNVSRQGHLLVP